MNISQVKPFIVLSIFLTLLSTRPAGGQPAPAPDFVPGELVIGFKSAEAQDSLLRDLQVRSGPTRGLDLPSVSVVPLGELSARVRIDLRMRGGRSPAKDAELRTLNEMARSFRADERVSYAHPNWILQLHRPRIDTPVLLKPGEGGLRTRSPTAAPDDPVFARGLQWHYLPPPRGMNAIQAWPIMKNSNAVVAVLDTGILADHPDIRGSQNTLAGFDFVRSQDKVLSADGDDWDADPADPGDGCDGRPSSWHGTHVAGTIGAGATNNGLGIAGVAWKASVLPVRVLGRCGGATADIAAAIRWSAGLAVPGAPSNPTPAAIINLSLGAIVPCTDLQAGVLRSAIAAARREGAVIVVSAGNDDIDIANVSPGGCPGVISVAAADGRGHLAPYSNFGAVSMLAPGGDLLRDDDGDGTADAVWSLVAPSAENSSGIAGYEGTSMAAPHITATLALAMGLRPELKGKPDIALAVLKATSQPRAAGTCEARRPCGDASLLDAARLLKAISLPAVGSAARQR